MTIKEYAKKLTKFVKENPKYANLKVIYAKDDEGNGFQEVADWGPTVGHGTDDYHVEFVSEESFEEYEYEEKDINVVCIN